MTTDDPGTPISIEERTSVPIPCTKYAAKRPDAICRETAVRAPSRNVNRLSPSPDATSRLGPTLALETTKGSSITDEFPLIILSKSSQGAPP